MHEDKMKLKIHPLKEGFNRDLAEVLVPLINGGIDSFLHAHGSKYSKELKGLLKGSLRKRVLNQILAEEPRLLGALKGNGPIPSRKEVL
jgi:hypothetical protein